MSLALELLSYRFSRFKDRLNQTTCENLGSRYISTGKRKEKVFFLLFLRSYFWELKGMVAFFETFHLACQDVLTCERIYIYNCIGGERKNECTNAYRDTFQFRFVSFAFSLLLSLCLK